MKVEDFISSGILESYVLGTATAGEIKQIREMENLYPEIKEEIDAIESSLLNYAEAHTNAPSKELKDKIQKQIFETQTNNAEATMISFKPEMEIKRNKLMRFIAAAAIVSLVISATFNFILTNRANKTEHDLSNIRNKNGEMAEQLEDLQTKIFEKENELSMIMKPGNKMISLKGMGNSPSSHAMIVWNPEDKMVLLNSISLPVPPEGMQYQLWAMMDGKTVNAGVFDMNTGSVMLKLKEMPPAQVFAVTLEKMGGSPVPNMNAVYLMGNV